MEEKKQYLNVPVSQLGEEPVHLVVKLLFDTPGKYEGKEYNAYYYKVTYNGQEETIRAYDGLHNRIVETGAGAGDTIRLTRSGTGKETKWACKVIDWAAGAPPEFPTWEEATRDDDDEPQYNPAHKDANPPREIIWSPMDAQELQTRLRLGEDTLKAIEQFVSLVEVFGTFGDASIDQKIRLAITAYINSDKVYRPGMIVRGESSGIALESKLNEEDEFMICAGEYVGSGSYNSIGLAVLHAIAYTAGVGAESVKKSLLSVGVTGADISDVDTETWRRAYWIFKDKTDGLLSDDEIRARYDIGPAF
jgi:hypothetical protein